ILFGPPKPATDPQLFPALSAGLLSANSALKAFAGGRTARSTRELPPVYLVRTHTSIASPPVPLPRAHAADTFPARSDQTSGTIRPCERRRRLNRSNRCSPMHQRGRIARPFRHRHLAVRN